MLRKLFLSEKPVPGISVLLLSLLLCAWVYLPGLNGPSLLDDATSIFVLDTSGIGEASFVEQALSDPSGPLGRPVSVASFLAERLWVGESIRVTKLFNLLLHLFNGVLVFLLLCRLGRLAGYRGSGLLAALCTALWLLSPLMVSTVLYAVQRMAILAALFSLLSINLYLSWRSRYLLNRPAKGRLLLFIITFFLAIFSKENAVVTFPILCLLELFWCREFREGSVQARRLRLMASISLAASLAGALCYLGLRWDSLISHYHYRDFSLIQRLFTEARVLWDYVGQFYLPNVHRMGLYHDDFPVSRELLVRPSPLPALLAWAGLLALSALWARHDFGRRFGCCLLLFLFAHSVESTILPLEIYFEHRNYLPSVILSLLLFLVFAEVAKRQPAAHVALAAWVGTAVLAFSLMTSSQAQVWSSKRLFTLSAMASHPRSFRANVDMAQLYAEVGDLPRALQHSSAANRFRDEYAGDHLVRNAALSCFAGATPELEATINEPLDPRRPLGDTAALNVLIDLVARARCPVEIIDPLLAIFHRLYLAEDSEATASPNVYLGLGSLAFYGEHFSMAYEFVLQELALVPDDTKGLLMALHFALLNELASDASMYRRRLETLQSAGRLTDAEELQFAAYTGE